MSNTNTNGAIARISREILHSQQGNDLSIVVAYRDSDVRHVRALIIGPPETPYEFGFFEFDMKFPRDYPIQSPKVHCITTNSGKTRFNPNIYAGGKVCLSILGTWRGQPGEEWSSAQGLESVLLSIQSLMSSNPYENEPGYETAKKEEPQPAAYIAKIRHETLRVSVIQRLEDLLQMQPDKSEPALKKVKTGGNSHPLEATPSPGEFASDGASTPSTEASAHEYDAEATYAALDSSQWDPFADLMKRRFLWYYDVYLKAIDEHVDDQRDGKAFSRMEFEYPPNSMEGHFGYKALKGRFEAVLSKLEEEKLGWEQAGAVQVAEGSQLATMLAFQFTQLQSQWEDAVGSGSKMEFSLPNPKNPFVWTITLFGEPMTNLDGGIFTLKMYIPPNFPTAQPRVTLETPIYHHRVASNGTLCYFPAKEDEISSHLEAIVAAIDDKKQNFDPRAMVNPAIFEQYWGGDEKRKIYNRKLRRSAQESSELL
jgi:ubiquitin-conjugating enzyme E2 Z